MGEREWLPDPTGRHKLRSRNAGIWGDLAGSVPDATKANLDPEGGAQARARDAVIRSGASKPPPEPTDRVQRTRVLGYLVILIAAGLVLMFAGPDSGAAEVAAARLTGALNQETTESAPQQQVANGWEANDLLEAIALGQTDNRVPYLLVLLIVAVAWHSFVPLGVIDKTPRPEE